MTDWFSNGVRAMTMAVRGTVSVFIFAACLVVSTPGLAQMMGGPGGGAPGGGGDSEYEPPPPRPSNQRPDPVGLAEEMRLAGKCQDALPILRNAATMGQGYEIAQFNLGQCLLDLSRTGTDAKAAAMRKEGASWILQAANAGFAQAQAEAVSIYLDGLGVAPDPVEAEKWALLYHSNGLRLTLGIADIPQPLSDRLDAALTPPKRDEAERRANAWTSTASEPDQ